LQFKISAISFLVNSSVLILALYLQNNYNTSLLMGVEDLRPKREIPINMVDAYSPIRYVGDPTKLPTDGIEAYDTVYLLDKDGTLHKFFGIDIIAPKLTSLTIAKKLASYAQTTDMRRATDSSTQPADNSRILMDELIG